MSMARADRYRLPGCIIRSHLGRYGAPQEPGAHTHAPWSSSIGSPPSSRRPACTGIAIMAYWRRMRPCAQRSPPWPGRRQPPSLTQPPSSRSVPGGLSPARGPPAGHAHSLGNICHLPSPFQCDPFRWRMRQRRVARALAYYAKRYSSKDRAIIEGSRSGAFSIREIGAYSGVGRMTVSRAVKKHELPSDDAAVQWETPALAPAICGNPVSMVKSDLAEKWYV